MGGGVIVTVVLKKKFDGQMAKKTHQEINELSVVIFYSKTSSP